MSEEVIIVGTGFNVKVGPLQVVHLKTEDIKETITKSEPVRQIVVNEEKAYTSKDQKEKAAHILED